MHTHLLLFTIFLLQTNQISPISYTQDTIPEFDSMPVFLLSLSEIERLSELVKQNESVQQIFNTLKDKADAALMEEPDPIRELHYEGYVSNHPERLQTINHLQDMRKLRYLSWIYTLTKQDAYLKAAQQYLLSWANTYKPSGNPINDNKLVAMILAYHLLQGKLGNNRQMIEDWLRQLALIEMATQRDSPQGNWHAKRIKIVGLIGIVLQEEKFINYARQEFQHYVASSLRPDGTSYDFEHRDAIHYHTSGISPMLEVAIALRSEDDLYRWETAEGASLEKSIQFVVPYALGEKTHQEWVNSQVALDRKRWESGDEKYRPGKLWNPQESLDMFELAVIFDPSLTKVVETLAPASEFSTWTNVLIYVIRQARR